MYVFWSIWVSWLLDLSVPDVKYMAPEDVDSKGFQELRDCGG